MTSLNPRKWRVREWPLGIIEVTAYVIIGFVTILYVITIGWWMTPLWRWADKVSGR